MTASSSKLPSAPPPVDDSGHDDAVHSSPGHVATDDKATLARRAAMASAPPDPDIRASLPHHSPRAPELEDDDEIPADVLALSSAPSSDPIPPYPSLHPDLPPPPSMGKMAASRYEQYAFSLEQAADVVGVEPEIGPSAPPFEEAQSQAGTTTTLVVVPSAPPVDEEGSYEDGELLEPSAPPLWYAETDSDGLGVGVVAGVDVEVNTGVDVGLAGEQGEDAGILRRTVSSVPTSRTQSPGPGPSAPSSPLPPVY